MKRISAQLYLSGSEGIREISSDGHVLRRMPLEGAGTICAGKVHLFCADAGGAIWKIRRDTLMPEAIFCAGPGICDLCLSADEGRLYALLGDADSVLMIDCRKGRPLFVNRCGCNPSQLLLCGDVLAAAGGQSGCVHLYDAYTLECRKEVSLPGPVCSVAVTEGMLYALCLSPQLDTLLVAIADGKRQTRLLSGMPGTLLVQGDCFYAATQGFLHLFSCRDLSLLCRKPVPGRPTRLAVCQEEIAAHDPLSEGLYILKPGRHWQMLDTDVKSFCLGSNGFSSSALDL